MVGFDEQLHGYRQGHQLLSSTIRLSRLDQDLIDRLSDVAGPLSPGERFAPYLTLYPLPSETHYVVARTWQDFDAPRAGCVRTRSLLVPMLAWQQSEDLAAIVAVVTQAGSNLPAERRVVAPLGTPLPPVPPAQGTELIEALFLEERMPIVVFGAEEPEALALRLTTALWAGFRRSFTMSTFARSPRTIGGRNFDLVFASKEARSRFVDWRGRRIDGKKSGQARHPWSAPIVERILESKAPSLKGLDVLGEMSSDGLGSESALRISLLWNDLRLKLSASPTAALGMLDILNTRKVRRTDLMLELEPALGHSAAMAVDSMPPADAWRFLIALIQKLQKPSNSVAHSIKLSGIELALRYPVETLDAISTINTKPQRAILLKAAASGLARSFDFRVAECIENLDAKDLLDLVLADEFLAGEVIGRLADSPAIMENAIRLSSGRVREKARQRLFPVLVENSQFEAVRLLLDDLDSEALVAAAVYIHSIGRLRSGEMREILIERARALQADIELRDAIVEAGSGAGGDLLVEASLQQTTEDLEWVLSSPALPQCRRTELIHCLLSAADLMQLRRMLDGQGVLAHTVNLLKTQIDTSADLLSRIASDVVMPRRDYVDLILVLLPNIDRGIRADLIGKAIDFALPEDPNDLPLSVLNRLLSAMGARLNGGKMMRTGLLKGVSSAAASRNVLAFSRTSGAGRNAILNAVEEMAEAMTGRRQLDLTPEAIEAAASLLEESEQVDTSGFLRASALLLPFALDDRRPLASKLVAASFPPVYRALAKENSFDLLGLMFVFLDWDKCKSARRRLVDAYLHSRWRTIDIVIAAVRANDPVRILGVVAEDTQGKQALQDLASDMTQLPDHIQVSFVSALKELGLR